MYFNAEAQEKILARFHFALNRNGYLFLGKAETLLAHASSFRPVDLKHRIFMRSPTSNIRDRLLALTPPGSLADPNGGARHLRLREAVFDAGPVAQIALDRQGYLVAANDKARRLFTLSASDLGRLLQDLEVSYRPVELRSHLEESYATRSPLVLKEVEWRSTGGGDSRQIEVHIVPLVGTRAEIVGASISFLDLTHSQQLRVALERINQELETAYEELQSANEELETTNEELQSTVEELETTNEELQSANEELETMNEELQSTNEELRAMNDQIQQRSTELNQVNSYFEAILTSLRSALAVLDRSLHIKIWSQKAEDLWGVRESEARGAKFLDLDIGLPVLELRAALGGCLDGSLTGHEVILDGVNRRGKAIRCQVRCSPLLGAAGIEGVILLMEDVEHVVS
jgi:two-component system, chemotaxis family, CheB/CheR fusion protein